MTHNLNQAIGTTLISPEILAKFELAEELRLVSSKMDRLYAEISRYKIEATSITSYMELLNSGTNAYRKELKRKYQCQKKKNTKSKNQKRTSTGSVTTRKSSWKFLEKLKHYWTASQVPSEELVD